MNTFWAGGFLYNPQNQSVLLHKRDSNTKFNPNCWAFFGGLNEANETPIQCFVRELNEEIGLKLIASDVKILYDYFNEEFQTHRFVFWVENSQNSSEFSLTEGEDMKWISLQKLPNYELTEKTKRDLDYFIQLDC